MHQNIIYIISNCLISIAFFTACTENNTITLNNEELIFTNSYPIEISSYTYADSIGTQYYVQGDSNYSLLPDTLNDRPILAWDSIYTVLVTVAISQNPILVSAGEITNNSDLVWQWHSGMEFNNYNRIQYSEGKNVINGEISYESTPSPLTPGHYYWAVWGWSNSGIRVLYSSRQHEFYVRE